MKNKITYFVFSITLIFIFSYSAQAQRETTTVKTPVVTTSASPSLVTLSVVDAPVGAEVYFNGKKIGLTDKEGKLVRSNLKPTTYNILVKYPEYEDFKEQVTIMPGKAEVISAKLKPTFAIILLTLTEFSPDLKVELDKTMLSLEKLNVDIENKTIRIKTTPGQHSIKISRTGYLPASNDSFKADVGEENTLVVSLERVPINLVVKSLAGTRLYVDDQQKGSVPNNGILVSELKPNKKYKVRLELDNYEPKEQEITTEVDKNIELNINLTPLPTSAAFSDSFLSGLAFWNTPETWKTNKGVLFLEGKTGVGLPKNKRYKDCNISFGLRLKKAGGAAWIIRARDEKNYYLFCLSGSKEPFASQFRVYICRDGVNLPGDPGLLLPVPIKVGEDYQIRIEISGNQIQHWITPSNDGNEYSLGFFKDPDNTFPIGGMGFALLDDQEFCINAFVVSLPTDAKPSQ